MAAQDRRERLREQTHFTGIDFILVDETPRQAPGTPAKLQVHLLVTPAPPLDVDTVRVSLRAQSAAADVPPMRVVRRRLEGGVLHLETDGPGGFASYVLRLEHERIDPFFREQAFSFKVVCPTRQDCRPPELPEAPGPEVDFPVDYEARDFQSLRRALLDFASQRHPRWADRLEADAGVMVAELLSALGDELSYYQDRLAREAYLETATQRRSLRRHVGLVDYRVHDGRGATTWLDVTVKAGERGTLKAGDRVSALRDGQEIVFEVGQGLAERFSRTPLVWPVDAELNGLKAYFWDADVRSLPVGATELTLDGKHQALLTSNSPPPGEPWSRQVLLRTTPRNPSEPIRSWRVRLVSVEEGVDPLPPAQDITHITWEPEQALPYELDLATLEVRCNLVPATAGSTEGPFFFAIREVPVGSPEGTVLAVERDGVLREAEPKPFRVTTFLCSLPGSERRELVWLGEEPREALPEVWLEEVEPASPLAPRRVWEWRPAFMGAAGSSLPDSAHYTLDDGTWRRLVGFQRPGGEVVHVDYAGNEGWTVRFGDGEFGRIPEPGTLFRVHYRLGDGIRANLPAGALTRFSGLTFVESITNPLPITDALAPESAEEVRQLAPEAFRAVTYRAVRPEDHAEAAERLPWVQRAGATQRWTGSWLTTFVTADPHQQVALAPARRRELEQHLERFRQAGRQVCVLEPTYVDLDLELSVCVEPSASAGDVEGRVLRVLVGGPDAFFSPERFTFGTPLELAELEAQVQREPGVRAVEGLRLRRRGFFDWKFLSGVIFWVGADEVVRVVNDPLHPARGTIRVKTRGGR
ncbi:hypothetical protein [Myxococcus sp. RHSTA-1-4]|uniref:hypothetical protein n=1 Tax=Myxococcus sp. RHSTA-1-4 TaxID=2874601 RepID=UPI001CBCA014|nr:hypothetical protein [Myxococcus sp. RHSTA-1-4]MBZ4420178.1 hypothetical protein [Myxococcus sp. RHSTA-1-4]